MKKNKIKENAKSSLGLESHLNEFTMKKENNLNRTTNLHQEEQHQSFEGEQEYTEEVEETEEGKIDDDLVER